MLLGRPAFLPCSMVKFSGCTGGEPEGREVRELVALQPMSSGGGVSAPCAVFEEFQLSDQNELCAGLRLCSTYLPSLEKIPASRFTKTEIQNNCLDEGQGRQSLSCPGHNTAPRASPAISQHLSLRWPAPPWSHAVAKEW